MTRLSCKGAMRKAIIWIGCAMLSACSLQSAALTQSVDRPGPSLDYANCQVAWRRASPHGEALSKDAAAPFVVDTGVVDENQDGKISEDEFKDGCQGGWVKAPSTVVCLPDQDYSLWPTFEVADKCGSYDKCTALARPEQARACTQQIDDCGVALQKANEKANAHNSALEACRSVIPALQKASPSRSGTPKA
jgi:hypothetical protein